MRERGSGAEGEKARAREKMEKDRRERGKEKVGGASGINYVKMLLKSNGANECD